MSGYRSMQLIAVFFLCTSISMYGLSWSDFNPSRWGSMPASSADQDAQDDQVEAPIGDASDLKGADVPVAPAVVEAPTCQCALRMLIPKSFLGKATLTAAATLAIFYGVYSCCTPQSDSEEECTCS